jgi:hypothetical protein
MSYRFQAQSRFVHTGRNQYQPLADYTHGSYAHKFALPEHVNDDYDSLDGYRYVPLGAEPLKNSSILGSMLKSVDSSKYDITATGTSTPGPSWDGNCAKITEYLLAAIKHEATKLLGSSVANWLPWDMANKPLEDLADILRRNADRGKDFLYQKLDEQIKKLPSALKMVAGAASGVGRAYIDRYYDYIRKCAVQAGSAGSQPAGSPYKVTVSLVKDPFKDPNIVNAVRAVDAVQKAKIAAQHTNVGGGGGGLTKILPFAALAAAAFFVV